LITKFVYSHILAHASNNLRMSGNFERMCVFMRNFVECRRVWSVLLKFAETHGISLEFFNYESNFARLPQRRNMDTSLRGKTLGLVLKLAAKIGNCM